MKRLHDGPLNGRPIFLSASTPSRDLEKYPRLQMEVENAVIELARAVFSKGGRLIFGGHPSISPLVASVASEYFQPDPLLNADQRPVQIYQSRAYEKVIPSTTQSLERFGYAAIHWTQAANGEEYDGQKQTAQCRASLRVMRQQMLKPEPIAMVAIGGMEGVAEEAGLFLQAVTGPVFAMRTTGGVSRDLRGHTENWYRHEEIPGLEQARDQIGARIRMLEDEFPAPELRMKQESGASVRAPYAFYLQKMVQLLIKRRNRD
jgi:hypothetical protein